MKYTSLSTVLLFAVLPSGTCTTPTAASGGTGGASPHPGASGSSGVVGSSLAY